MVIDASVWISHLIPSDVNHSASRDWVRRHLTAGGRLTAPAILLVEVGGAIAWRNTESERGLQAVNDLLALPLLRLMTLTKHNAERAAQLAAMLQFRGADALYVEVAQRLRQPLITWDNEQLSRAQAIIPVYTPLTVP